jgi:hypothetical protein
MSKETIMTKIAIIAPIAGLAFLLTACSSTGTAPAVLTPTQIQSGVQSGLQDAGAVLTATEQAMCSAQAAANLAGAVANTLGDANAASGASKASTIAGEGCTWATPAPTATPAVPASTPTAPGVN